jgi:hypothetical protein
VVNITNSTSSYTGKLVHRDFKLKFDGALGPLELLVR